MLPSSGVPGVTASRSKTVETPDSSPPLALPLGAGVIGSGLWRRHASGEHVVVARPWAASSRFCCCNCAMSPATSCAPCGAQSVRTHPI
eukprot:5711604-Prymnesium_polylepis.1